MHTFRFEPEAATRYLEQCDVSTHIANSEMFKTLIKDNAYENYYLIRLLTAVDNLHLIVQGMDNDMVPCNIELKDIYIKLLNFTKDICRDSIREADNDDI